MFNLHDAVSDALNYAQQRTVLRIVYYLIYNYE